MADLDRCGTHGNSMQHHICDAVKPREALGHNVKPSLHSRCEALMVLAAA